MNDNENKIRELLNGVYGVPPTPVQLKRMERERRRIMRELPQGIRSPLITLRLVLILSVWGMLGVGCIFCHQEIIGSLMMVYRHFALQQPFPEEFVFRHLPCYMVVLLGLVETYNFGKETM
jgi:hypothetical protein